jgi:hypothetical protein
MGEKFDFEIQEDGTAMEIIDNGKRNWKNCG